jgi:hypothetical protein
VPAELDALGMTPAERLTVLVRALAVTEQAEAIEDQVTALGPGVAIPAWLAASRAGVQLQVDTAMAALLQALAAVRAQVVTDDGGHLVSPGPGDAPEAMMEAALRLFLADCSDLAPAVRGGEGEAKAVVEGDRMLDRRPPVDVSR